MTDGDDDAWEEEEEEDDDTLCPVFTDRDGNMIEVSTLLLAIHDQCAVVSKFLILSCLLGSPLALCSCTTIYCLPALHMTSSLLLLSAGHVL